MLGLKMKIKPHSNLLSEEKSHDLNAILIIRHMENQPEGQEVPFFNRAGLQ